MRFGDTFKLSRTVLKESFFRGQMIAAGSQQSRVLERFSKKPKSIGGNLRFINAVVAFYLLVILLLPAGSLARLAGGEGSADAQVLLVSVGVLTLACLLQIAYVLLFAVMTSQELVRAQILGWLLTLPLSRDDVRQIGFAGLVRAIVVQLGAIVVGLPVLVAIVVGSLPAVLAALAASVTNAGLAAALFVLLASAVSRLMHESGNSPGKRILRTVALAGYGIGTIVVVLLVQLAISLVPELYTAGFLEGRVGEALRSVLPFFPVFGPAGLTSIAAARSAGGLASAGGASAAAGLPILPAVVGTLLGFVVCALLLRRARRVLSLPNESLPAADAGGSRGEAGGSARQVPDEARPGAAPQGLRVRSPVQAYLRRDLSIAARDSQLLLSLLLPPLFAVMTVVTAGGESPLSELLGLFGYMNVVGAFIAAAVAYTLSVTESTGATLTAALPVPELARARAKLILFLASFGAMNLVVFAFAIPSNGLGSALADLARYVTVPALAAWAGLFFKMLLTGRLRNRYTLDEVQGGYRLPKWLLSALGAGLIGAGAVAIELALSTTMGPDTLIAVGAGVAYQLLIYFLLRAAFAAAFRRR
jgi:hypothetical protein